MEHIITVLKDTPIPTILVIAGVMFLVLAVAEQLGGRIVVNKEARKWSGAIGLIMVAGGVSLYLLPKVDPDSSDKTQNKNRLEKLVNKKETTPQSNPTTKEAIADRAKRVDINSVNAKFSKVVFFDADILGKPRDRRIYLRRFPVKAVNYIWAEVHLVHSPPGDRVPFTINVAWISPGGGVRNYEQDSHISADWTSSYHTIRLAGPPWSVGTYKVELYINKKRVTNDSIEIYD